MQNDLLFPESRKNKSASISAHFYVKKSKPKLTPVFDTYWKFAVKRQELFFQKIKPSKSLPKSDPILHKYKFTNAYRASDRVSQYLIQKVIYTEEFSIQNLFFRIILFKIFNKIETWELLEQQFGPINYDTYSYGAYNQVLLTAMRNKKAIYSAAYIMASGKSVFGHKRKHQNHLKLVEKMIHEKVPERISLSKSMQDVYTLLLSYPSIGPFLAYQLTIDINYSPIITFSEMDFVVPGPGAKDGIKKCFADPGGLSEIDLIQLMADRQALEFERLGLSFQDLWGRPLQLIDCQNLFCEVDKYARVAHPEISGYSNRKRIKQKYKRNHSPINYWYPPSWEINEKIYPSI